MDAAVPPLYTEGVRRERRRAHARGMSWRHKDRGKIVWSHPPGAYKLAYNSMALAAVGCAATHTASESTRGIIKYYANTMSIALGSLDGREQRGAAAPLCSITQGTPSSAHVPRK